MAVICDANTVSMTGGIVDGWLDFASGCEGAGSRIRCYCGDQEFCNGDATLIHVRASSVSTQIHFRSCYKSTGLPLWIRVFGIVLLKSLNRHLTTVR